LTFEFPNFIAKGKHLEARGSRVKEIINDVFLLHRKSCFMDEGLRPLAQINESQGFTFTDEGRSKLGYVGSWPGASLVLMCDTLTAGKPWGIKPAQASPRHG
jgi:hypothetical protein